MEVNYFLRLKVKRSKDDLFLSERKYILDLLKKAEIEFVKPISTPMSTAASLSHCGTLFHQANLFRSIVGGLQYLTFTRPDISFAVNRVVAQFMQTPLDTH